MIIYDINFTVRALMYNSSIITCMYTLHVETWWLIIPGQKDTRNFVMRPYLRLRVPINAMRLIFMCNLCAHVN